MTRELEEARRALSAWALEAAEVCPLGTGLINRTFLVEEGGSRSVLQRVNPIFEPRIHENILAVTNALRAANMTTLELVPSRDGRLWVEADGVYRLYRHLDGVAFDVATSAAQLQSAGRLVGAFHAAVARLDHEFVGQRLGVHDTARHLDTLRRAVSEHSAHRLFAPVRALAAELLAAAERLPSLPPLPNQIGHGDLKLSNVLFCRTEPATALCLVDLDTLGPIHLAHELGDMWRSWCNRATEDDVEADLDLDVLHHSWAGYVSGLGRAPSHAEREAALVGLDWISLELTARFAADALNETYFGWNPSKFPSRGEHNLQRAAGQWSLHQAVVRTRAERRALLGI